MVVPFKIIGLSGMGQVTELSKKRDKIRGTIRKEFLTLEQMDSLR